MRTLRHLTALAAAAFLLAGAGAQAQEIDVRAYLQPKEIHLGNGARMIIEVRNGREVRAYLPKVRDLIIQFRGQSVNQRSITVQNGVAQYQTNKQLVYTVIPYQEGDFEVPPFEIEVDGQLYKTQPMSLRVLPGQKPAQVQQTPNPPRNPSAGTSPGTRQPSTASGLNFGITNSQARNPASNPTAPSSSSAARNRQEPTFVELEIPKKEVYVGEMIPVRLVWYVRRGIQHQPTFPVVPSEAFVNNLANTQAVSREEYVGNEIYVANIWEFTMTAVKEGDYKVDAEIETVLTVPVQGRPGSPFANFGSRFHNRVRRYEKTLNSTPVAIKIKPLPTEGRPATFDGAVGEFNLTASATPNQVDVGEPITLTTNVQGIGDLGRVNAPTLENDEGWRIYPPTSDVVMEAGPGDRGKKTFEQAIIARQAGIKTIPPIVFSYFNPNTSQYVTRKVDGPPVKIIGSPDAIKNLPKNTGKKFEATDDGELVEMDSLLVGNKQQLGWFWTDFSRVALQPWFLALQGVPLLAMLVGFIVITRKRRLENDPEYARQVRLKRGLQEAQQRMHAAASAQDEPAFFEATRSALQHRLALETKEEPGEVTPEVIANYAPESARSAEEIFNQADAMAYGSGASTRPLSQWQDLAQTTMMQMEQECRQQREQQQRQLQEEKQEA